MISLHHNSVFSNVFPFFRWESKRIASAKSTYYQSRLNRIDSWEKLYILVFNENKFILNTEQSVLFYNIPFGVSQKVIVQKFGNPRHKLDNDSKIKGHEVYFYKFNFYGIVAKCEVHFINKTFFLASYFFNRTMDGVSKEVLDIIVQKYTKDDRFAHENAFQIEDQQKNKLIIENDVDYVLTYLSGDANLYASVLNQITEQDNRKTQGQLLRKEALRKAL